jgi:hypothetical protein
VGYDLHIHRRKNHWEKGDDISVDEWTAACSADPSLEVVHGDIEQKTPDGLVLKMKSPGPRAKWTDQDGNELGWFHYLRGRITTSYADTATITKAYEIAQRLSARVQGDEGEFYGPDGSVLQ